MRYSPSQIRLVGISAFLLVCLCAGIAVSSQSVRMLFANQKTPDFRLRTESTVSEDDAQHLLRLMLELQAEIQWQLGLPETHDSVDVSLFSNHESYFQFVNRHFPDATDRNALFIKRQGTGTVVLHQNPDLLNDLRHECTHAVLHKSLKNLPLWLDEGLAEYFEQPADLREHGNSWWAESRAVALKGWRPDLQRLETLQNLSEMTTADYRESWLWVHFLMHGPDDVQGVLHRYIQRSEAAPISLSAFLEDRNTEFGQLLHEHLMQDDQIRHEF